MDNSILNNAIETLSEQFRNIHWSYLEVPPGSPREKTQLWPGDEKEDIMICVAHGSETNEMFHRQDFFFFNYAYKGDYGAVSYKYDNQITIHENECYIGQPYAGYAIQNRSPKEIIVGVLIKTDTFFKTFLPVLSSDAALFHFFLEPQTNEYSEEYIHLRFDDDIQVRTLLEMMIIEYANKREDTQAILRPMALTLFMQVARQYKRSIPIPENETLSDKIVRFMGEHTDVVTLKDIAQHFSYHPNYISTLLKRELGKSFSELLLEQRMQRATSLLKGTNLSIEEIAFMLGYSNSSNFYKAFREYYHCSPRDYC
ncbi:MAG: helix-turn-helix transcriptional regulator [Lachnospiraceae bacterium]|nr:helix-turn-helix transcriptional regulator [Lachnospiraceae bacterium]